MPGSLSTLEHLRGQRVAIVASTGGHLEQAIRWSDRLDLSPESVFITFDSAQSRGLLRDRRHEFVSYIAPRDLPAVVHAIRTIRPIIQSHRVSAILSTGAGIALAAYVAKIATGRALYYVESISRYNGPSLSGRILARLPGVKPYAQHSGYSSRWTLVENLLSNYAPGPPRQQTGRHWRIFVTLGTIRPYRFDSLVQAVLMNTHPDDHIIWQLGETTRTGLPGTAHQTVTPDEFDQIATSSDLVITHAGVGTILRLLDLGISPIAVPRTRYRGEHTDNHQEQVANALAKIGLLTNSSPDELTFAKLHHPRPTIEQPPTRSDQQ